MSRSCLPKNAAHIIIERTQSLVSAVDVLENAAMAIHERYEAVDEVGDEVVRDIRNIANDLLRLLEFE
jgi:hypothetical protein